jgi:flagellar biosynthesis protein FliQ
MTAIEPHLLAIGREALLLVVIVSAPALLAALVVGVVGGILQAATQVQDPSLGAVPRLVAVLVALACTGPWISARVVRFALTCLDLATRSGS